MIPLIVTILGLAHQLLQGGDVQPQFNRFFHQYPHILQELFGFPLFNNGLFIKQFLLRFDRETESF